VASALAVAEAGLVIANGAGYDDFVSQLLGVTRNSGRVVVSAQAVLAPHGPDVNPHFWYYVLRVPEVAAEVGAALARLDPREAPLFRANLKASDASLARLDAAIASSRAGTPARALHDRSPPEEPGHIPARGPITLSNQLPHLRKYPGPGS